MIAPEHLSNAELERLAYQSGDVLMQELARRIADDHDHDDDEYDELEAEIDDAEARADEAEEALEDMRVLCADAARALRSDGADKWVHLIERLEAA